MSIVGKLESFGRGLMMVVNSLDTNKDMRLNEACSYIEKAIDWQTAHSKQLFAFSHLSPWLHLGPGFVERLILRLPGLETLSQQVFVSVDTATDQLFHSMARAHGAGDRASSAIGFQRSDRPVGRLMLQTWLPLQ